MLSPANIDAIVMTHDHTDHVGDFLPPVSMLHEARSANGAPQRLYVCMSPSTQRLYEISKACMDERYTAAVLTAGQALVAWEFGITPFPVHHDELSPVRGGARGLRIDLLRSDRRVAASVGFTADTGWFPELASCLLGPLTAPQVVVAHVGDIYPEDLDLAAPCASNHLGLKGLGMLVHDIRRLRGDYPWLCVVSEWGPAMAGLESPVGSGFGKHVGTGGAIAPAVMGLRIALPQAAPVCQLCGDRLAGRWQEVPVGSLPAAKAPATSDAQGNAPSNGLRLACVFICQDHDRLLSGSA